MMFHGRHATFRRGAKGKKRPPPGTMNRYEERYAEHLAARVMAGEVLAFAFEPVTFKIAADTRYTPDFMVQLADLSIEFHEVKAMSKKGVILKDEKAYVKIKVAAQQNPQFTFRLIGIPGKTSGVEWKFQEIEPI